VNPIRDEWQSDDGSVTLYLGELDRHPLFDRPNKQQRELIP